MNYRTRDSFYSIWSAAIILSVLLALFTVFFVSCQKGDETAAEALPAETEEMTNDAISDPQPTPEEPAVTEDPAAAVVLAQTSDYGADYLSRFVFLGDTNTLILSSSGAIPQKQVWSTEDGTMELTDHAATYILYEDDSGSTQEMMIYNAAAVRQPEYLLINLGQTGLNRTNEAEFKAAYRSLIETIHMASPNTKILCQSILPVMDSLSGDISNGRINKTNKWILEVAAETGTAYLNAAELLMDETGNLRAEYASSNGMTLSEAGCEALLMYVRTHAYM